MEFEVSNVSTNVSNVTLHQSTVSYILTATLIRNICIPVIAAIGFIGNTMSILVFTTRSMRTSSCSVFLAALALVDNMFLISLVVTWVDGEWYTLLTTEALCMVLVFITYLTSFLSVWFIVGFTCERFLAICFPLRCNFLCTVFREKIAVLAMSVIAVILYSFSFWTTGMERWRGVNRCSHRPDYLPFMNIVTWVDTALTMVIPFVLISSMNLRVLCTILHHFRVTPSNLNRLHKILHDGNKNIRPVQRRRFPTLRVTRTVLLVSTTFLFLNLPSHIIRLFTLIHSTSSDTSSPAITWKFWFMQEMAQLLYYSTFSCNFILYTLFGRNFKRSLISMLRCKSTSETHRQNMIVRLSSTQGCSPVTSV